MNPTQPFEPSADQDPLLTPEPGQPQPSVVPAPITPPSVRPQVVRPRGTGWLYPTTNTQSKRKKLVMAVSGMVVVLGAAGYFLWPAYVQRQNTHAVGQTADTFMDGLVAGDYEKVQSVYSGRDLKREDVAVSNSDNIEKSPRLGLDVKTKDGKPKGVATYKLTIKGSGSTTAYIVVLLGKDTGQWKVKNLIPSFAVEPKADVDSYQDTSFEAGANLTGQQNKHDIEREVDIKAIHGQLEAYYAEHGHYPTLANLNDPAFRTHTLKGLDKAAFKDPAGKTETLSDKPAKNIYAYEAVDANGEACDNKDKDCVKYTLTATKDNGTLYTKAALN